MEKTFPIKGYDIFLGRKLQGASDRGTSRHYYALVSCRGEPSGQLDIIFLTPDSGAYSNATRMDPPYGRICVSAEQYPFYLDLLRNEKIVTVTIDDTDPNQNRIRSGGKIGWGHIE